MPKFFKKDSSDELSFSTVPVNEKGLVLTHSDTRGIISRTFSVSGKEKNLNEAIEDHDGVKNFDLVCLIPNEGRSKKSILDLFKERRQFTPKDNMPLDNLPVLNFNKPIHEFSLSDVIKSFSSGQKDFTVGSTKYDQNNCWISLKECVILFNGSSPFYSRHSTVKIMIQDRRRISDSVIRSVTTLDNVGSNVFFSLEFSVHIKDLNRLFIVFERSSSATADLTYWGSARVELQISASKEALPLPLIPTVATMFISPTVLTRFKSDPTKIDLTLDEKQMPDLIKLKKMKLITELKSDLEVEDFGGSEAGSDVGFKRVGFPMLGSFLSGLPDNHQDTNQRQTDSETQDGAPSVGRVSKEARFSSGGPSVIKDDDVLDRSEWTEFAITMSELTNGLVKFSGMENSVKSTQGLSKFIQHADQIVLDCMVHFFISQGGSGDNRISHIPMENYDSMRFVEFCTSFQSMIFDHLYKDD